LTRARQWLPLGLLAAALAATVAAPARAMEYISPEEWPQIQRGIQVTQYARLAAVVNELDRRDDGIIAILHPGGDAGYDWAIEIRDWFVALGVPSRRIALRPGSGVPGSLGLRVEEQRVRRR
jgi:hypothetical protein